MRKSKYSNLFQILIIGLVSALAGCQAISNLFDDPTGQAVSRLAFDYAVNYAIDDRNIDPAKIVAHMEALQGLLDGDAEASVSVVANALVARIDFQDLEPSQAAFVRALIPILAARAEAEIEARGLIPEDSRVVVSEVLQWIEDSARLRCTNCEPT